MPDAIVPLGDALDRVLTMIRKRIEDARANGQKIRMVGRESGRQVMPHREFISRTLEEIIASTPPDGGFELHIYIEPKR